MAGSYNFKLKAIKNANVPLSSPELIDSVQFELYCRRCVGISGIRQAQSQGKTYTHCAIVNEAGNSFTLMRIVQAVYNANDKSV